MLIRLGYTEGIIETINVENNNFEVYGYGSLIKFGSNGVERVKDINVMNNNIKFNKITGDGFALFQVDNSEGENINIINNQINVESNIDEKIAGSCLVSGNINFSDNLVDINYKLKYIAIGIEKFCNNNVKIYGSTDTFFTYTNTSLSKNIEISNNIFEINDEESWERNNKIFLSLYEMYFNNFYILLNENEITLLNNQDMQQTFVNFNNVKDETIQKVYSYNNNLGNFTNIINYQNNVQHVVLNQMP